MIITDSSSCQYICPSSSPSFTTVISICDIVMIKAVSTTMESIPVSSISYCSVIVFDNKITFIVM